MGRPRCPMMRVTSPKAIEAIADGLDAATSLSDLRNTIPPLYCDADEAFDDEL